MSLFGRKEPPRKPHLEVGECVALVQDFARQFNLNAEPTFRNNEKTGWQFSRGSAEVLIIITAPKDATQPCFIEVRSRIMTLPQDGILPLYRRLLELNSSTLVGAKFGVQGELVVICDERNSAGLDKVELESMIHRVSSYADKYDDELVAEFGGLRYHDKPK